MWIVQFWRNGRYWVNKLNTEDAAARFHEYVSSLTGVRDVSRFKEKHWSECV